MRSLLTDSNVVFREARKRYISKMLDIVQKEDGSHVSSHIQDITGSYRECQNCSKRYSGMKRKCDVQECGGKVSKVESESPRIVTPSIWKSKKHFDIGQVIKCNKLTPQTGETILVNPNGYDSIYIAALELHDDLEIGEKREWAPLGCDGPPLTYLSRLIEEKEDLGWILPIPGLGHLHMNQLKTFFRVADDIFLHPLGTQVLNFKSKTAYEYFVNAKDTHKSFQSLEILLHGTALEFCREYLNANKTSKPSVAGFLNWASDNPNERFNLVFQLIFTYAFAIYAQKVGVRCNDSSLIDAARFKFMPMFYGFDHPIYQEIEYRDLQLKARCPPPIAQFIRDNASFTTNSQLDHQGGDFCLEGKIKRQKMMAPKGDISKETWQRIGRSVDKMEKIQLHLNETLGNVYDDKERKIDIYDEICKWRAVLRHSKIIDSFDEEGLIKNIYNEPLSHDLDDFIETLTNQMSIYWNKAAEGIPLKSIRMELLHVTENTNIADLEWDGDSSDDEC